MTRSPREKTTTTRQKSLTGKEEKLSSYSRPEAVLDLTVESKEELLRALAEVVIPDAGEDLVEKIYQGMEEREAAVNTYVGNGVAIPHARVDCVEGISLAIARNPEGFPYGIDTDEPVVLAVLIVGDEKLQSQHMQLLGAIASLLVNRDLRDQILQAPDAAAVLRLFDSRKVGGPRRKGLRLAKLLLSHTRRIAREMGVTAILVNLESMEELKILKRMPRRGCFVVATTSPRLAEHAEKVVKRVLLLPKVHVSRSVGVKLTALMALTHGLINRGDVVAFLSGNEKTGLDTMTIVEIGRQIGRFVTPSGAVAPGISPEALERVIALATELAAEGREGKPIGTLFVIVGDEEKLSSHTQQMVMNPFRGYPEEERNILDPTLTETIKEFAAIDGAFVVRGDGVVHSAGTFLKSDEDVDLPGGYGSRHLAACAVTKAAKCVAVALSQSTGEVTIFKGGSVILTLPRTRGG